MVWFHGGGWQKVLTMLTAPSAKGLFHKGIVQSGASEVEKIKAVPFEELFAAVNKALQEAGTA